MSNEKEEVMDQAEENVVTGLLAIAMMFSLLAGPVRLDREKTRDVIEVLERALQVVRLFEFKRGWTVVQPPDGGMVN
jgi:uncharacterized membrane protein